MRRALLGFVLAATLPFPIGVAWGQARVATLHPASHVQLAKAKKYKGPAINMHWGPVQVTIAVKGKKITNVIATAPTDRSRSAFINGQALPLLKQEVLRAQSAAVGVISGATMTSQAYMQSLQAAMQKAHL
jgi:uncharacterized protein with FMN-binding domain